VYGRCSFCFTCQSGLTILGWPRVLTTGSDRILHVINLTSPEQVDDQLGQWLEVSYDFNTDGVRPET
jgi:hypothetical protein